jgi:hypothetical protein
VRGAALLSLLLLLPGLAEAACPSRGQPAIRFELDDPEPRVLPPVPAAELAARHGGAPASGHHHLGLTTTTVAWRAEMQLRVQSEPGGGVCAVPAELRLSLVHREHSIRLAAEIPPEGCLAREVLAHERRHVEVNRRTLREAAGAVRGVAERWAARAESRAPTAEAAGAELQRDLERAMAPVLERLRSAREAAHDAIDSEEEYRRLGRVCPEDQQRLRAAFGR